MAVHHRTKSFILAKKDLREADQLFTVYTCEFGKINVLGRSIRKINSKLRSGMDLFYFSEIEFIQGKSCKTLTDAAKISQMGDFGHAQKIAEVFNILVIGQEKDEKIWDLLIEASKITASPIAYPYFFWKFLFLLGYGPDLYACAQCKEKLTPLNNCFVFRKNGIACEKCSGETASGLLSADAIKALRLFLEKSSEDVLKISFSAGCLEEIFSVTGSYLDYWKNR